MMRVRTCTIGIALAAFACAASTSASQLNLVPVLQISGQWSDNVFFTENAKQSDTFFVINPGIALDYASDKMVASVSYQAGLQRYRDFEIRDNDVHAVNASLGFSLGTNFYLDVVDNLYITTDPLAFDAAGDRVQRDSFNYNRVSPGLSYEFSNRKVRASARYDRVDIDYDTLVDSSQNGFGGNLSAKIGHRSTIGLDYFQFKREFDEQFPEHNVVDYTARRVGVTLDRRISPQFSISATGGWEAREFDINPEENDFDSFIFSFRANGDLPDIFSWSLSASQRLNDLAIQGAYTIRRIDGEVRKTIAERVRMEFNGYFQNSENEQIPEEADFFGFKVEGQVLVARFLNLWLGYEYVDRDSPDGSLRPFQENRVNFGLTLSYGL